MTQPLVCALRSVEIGVPDVALAEKFYVDTWLLTAAARSATTVYLRGTGAAHHLLSLTQTEKPELLAVTFNAASRKEVDALAQSVPAHGGARRCALNASGLRRFMYLRPLNPCNSHI